MTTRAISPFFLWFESLSPSATPAVALAQATESAARYVCGHCHHVICKREARTTFGDAFEHTFFNPHGILFQIGCFTQAPGTRLQGTPSNDFSWFPGFYWQAVSCRSCDQHLGWFFTGSGSAFYGLILPRLVFLED